MLHVYFMARWFTLADLAIDEAFFQTPPHHHSGLSFLMGNLDSFYFFMFFQETGYG